MAHAKGSVDPTLHRKTCLDFNAFPCGQQSSSFAINDLGCQQHILSNEHNFSTKTECHILDIHQDGTGQWHNELDDHGIQAYLQTFPSLQSRIAARILFLTLDTCGSATFGCKLSIDQRTGQAVLEGLEVRPEFVPLMLGQFVGNHLPPADFQNFDAHGQLKSLDFICQQPRWGFRVRQWPISVWMGFQEETGVTSCIITSGSGDKRIEDVQTRLTSAFTGPSTLIACVPNALDPFFFQSLVSHECFMQSDSSVFDLGTRLYGALDLVDAASEGSYDRDNIKSLTFRLHQISQDADALIQSADIGIALMDSMRISQERLAYWSTSRSGPQIQQSINTSDYLKKAMEARKRWLLGAKSRKETTMNLVYNLVSQKEAETNIAIARDTKNDSSSMKAIAALTMVFLPTSAGSGFFGMSFFDARAGEFTVAPEWWLFLIVTVPLTVVVLASWRLWEVFDVQTTSLNLRAQQGGLLCRVARTMSRWKLRREDRTKEKCDVEHV